MRGNNTMRIGFTPLFCFVFFFKYQHKLFGGTPNYFCGNLINGAPKSYFLRKII